MFGPVEKPPPGFGPTSASPTADAHPASSIAKPTTATPSLSLSIGPSQSMVGLQMDRVSVVSRVSLVNSGKAPSILVTASGGPLHSAGGRGPESICTVDYRWIESHAWMAGF